MPLTREEREQLLSELLVGALGVESGDEGAPVVLPIWYIYLPNGDVMIVTERDSHKAALIAKAGRFTLMVDRVAPTLRYVSVEGPVVEMRRGTRDDIRDLAAGYVPPERVAAWVDDAEARYGAAVAITMRPERSFAADLGPV